MLLRSLILREASLFATLNSLGLMIETHRISNFVRDIVHIRRAVALGRASAEDADKVYVAYLDSVMVRSKAKSPVRARRRCPSCGRSCCSPRSSRRQTRELLVWVEKMHRS